MPLEDAIDEAMTDPSGVVISSLLGRLALLMQEVSTRRYFYFELPTMTSDQPLPESVRKLAQELFTALDAEQALRLLASTPLPDTRDAATLETIHIGLLRMSKGDLKRLRGSLEYFDPRDALYAALGVDWDEEMRKGNLWTPN